MNLPNQFNYLQQMDLVIRLEMALAGDGNMVVYSLKKAISDKQPTNLILKTCNDMIRDNYNAMAFILGEDLCNRIKNFKP